MNRLLWIVLCLCTASQSVWAGPNAGGTLIVHNAGIGYSTLADLPVPPPSTPPTDCSTVDNIAPVGTPSSQCVWKVYAAFAASSSPRVKGLTWGITGTGLIYVTAAGLPDQEMCFEIVQGIWPSPAMYEYQQSSVGQSFAETQTAHVIDCHWFGGYGYQGATFSTGPHDTQVTEFVDDAVPEHLDAIAGFSTIGFGVPGDTQCPVAAGACCAPTGICVLTREIDCILPSVWHGDWPSCDPNPCEPASDVSVIPWGANYWGQLDVPAPNVKFMAIAAGHFHSLGIRASGAMAAWGDNLYGQCNVPEPNADFSAVAGGYWHSLGVKSGGSIVAWGYNTEGQCNVPAPNTDFVAAAGGFGHSLGLKSGGSIVGWGDNRLGQCTVPAPNDGFVEVAAGMWFSLGLKSDGSIEGWGYNFYGQCDVPEPNADFVAVAAGYSHGLGLKSDGSIVAWGDNYMGQCNVPAPNVGFVELDGGGSHSLGVRSDGSIVAWGDNTVGQCNVPPPNTRFVAVAGGGVHSLGLLGPLPGACCRVDGTCAVTSQEHCQPPDIWQGAGTNCFSNPCEATPVLLESWQASSLSEGLALQWEMPIGTTGVLCRAWRDASATSRDVAPTPDAVLVSAAWVAPSAEGIVAILDPAAPPGEMVRYFLEMSSGGSRSEFLGPLEGRWDPPALAWSVGPNPSRSSVRFVPPGPGRVRVEIFDAAGRSRRVLEQAGSGQPIEWDGRDDAGRPLASGIYLCRLESGLSKETRRINLVR